MNFPFQTKSAHKYKIVHHSDILDSVPSIGFDTHRSKVYIHWFEDEWGSPSVKAQLLLSTLLICFTLFNSKFSFFVFLYFRLFVFNFLYAYCIFYPLYIHIFERGKPNLCYYQLFSAVSFNVFRTAL